MNHKHCGGEVRIMRMPDRIRCYLMCLKCGKVYK